MLKKNSKLAQIVILSFISFTILQLPLQAHHILGLPHYSYKENYPQVPILEYPATSGPYEILMTCYPGEPKPGDTAKLAIYIKEQKTELPYNHPIKVKVIQTFTFGSNKTVLPVTTVMPYQQPHEIAVIFPTDGEYIVELTMEVEGKPEVIPFLMVAGNPSATFSVLAAIGGGLALFIVCIRAIKIKRQRKIASKEQQA